MSQMHLPRIALALLATLLLATPPAFAKGPSCSAQATAQKLKGTARKTFMKHCSNSAAQRKKPAGSQQQQKNNCKAQAKALKGAQRKAFLSNCGKTNG